MLLRPRDDPEARLRGLTVIVVLPCYLHWKTYLYIVVNLQLQNDIVSKLTLTTNLPPLMKAALR